MKRECPNFRSRILMEASGDGTSFRPSPRFPVTTGQTFAPGQDASPAGASSEWIPGAGGTAQRTAMSRRSIRMSASVGVPASA